MSITASQLLINARSVLGLNFQDGRLDDNNIPGVMASINRGIMQFSFDKNWPFLYVESSVSTVANQNYVALPSSTVNVAFVSLQDQRLKQIQRSQSSDFYNVTNRPVAFSVLAEKIYLTPTPDAVYSLTIGRYTNIPAVATPVALSGLTSTTITMPDSLVGLLTLYVAKELSLILKDRDGYQLVMEELKMEKQRLDDNVRLSTSPIAPATRRDY